jgi:hypothetical protein
MSKVLESLIPDATAEIRPFHISVPQEAIADLRTRLRATRFPNEQPVKDWSQGVPLAQARGAGAVLGIPIRLAALRDRVELFSALLRAD